LKILCLTHHDLDAPAYGAALRAGNLFRLLAQHGDVRVIRAGSHKFWDDRPQKTFGGFELLRSVQFLPTPKFSIAEKFRHEFDPRFLNTNGFQANAADRAWLQNAIAEHDLVWIYGLTVANGFGLWRWPNAVLDIDDIPSSFYRSELAHAKSLGQKLRNCRQIFLWSRHERTLPERFDALCVCSEPDKKIMGGAEKIFVLPNGFNPPDKETARQPATPPRLGFIGTFGYAPNRDGVRWFVENVWPLVLKKFPAARLRLVGSKSENENFSSAANVDALGFVEDTAAEMATWSLSIVPVLVGGGTRIKIAEAFSRKCPVVSTSLGAYGYDVADGRELLLADTAPDFAAKCLRLLTNSAEGKSLAEKGWRKYKENWTWDLQAAQIARIVERAAKKS
jgi:glycosyltransferase involved in cell wall biosynthesis